MAGFKGRYANLRKIHEPINCPKPSAEDWETWDKLETLSKSVWEAENVAFASRENDPSGADAARGVQMQHYDAQVKWMAKFGFKSFEDVEIARAKVV